MPLRKEIDGQQGYWTITDANLSPDNARCVTSLQDLVTMRISNLCSLQNHLLNNGIADLK